MPPQAGHAGPDDVPWPALARRPGAAGLRRLVAAEHAAAGRRHDLRDARVGAEPATVRGLPPRAVRGQRSTERQLPVPGHGSPFPGDAVPERAGHSATGRLPEQRTHVPDVHGRGLSRIGERRALAPGHRRAARRAARGDGRRPAASDPFELGDVPDQQLVRRGLAVQFGGWYVLDRGGRRVQHGVGAVSGLRHSQPVPGRGAAYGFHQPVAQGLQRDGTFGRRPAEHPVGAVMPGWTLPPA